jgi:hypothetical protein
MVRNMRELWRIGMALLLAAAPVAAEAQAAADAIVSVAQQGGSSGGVDVTMSLDEATLRALVDGARWAASSLLAYFIGRSQPIPSKGLIGRLLGMSETPDSKRKDGGNV